MIKKILIIITTILLSSTLVSIVFIFIISNTLLNINYIKKVLEKNDYYKKTENRIKEELSSYAPQLHVDDEVINLDNICDLEMIKTDINTTIDNIYNNKQITIDKNKIIDKLTTRINELLNKHHKTPSK